MIDNAIYFHLAYAVVAVVFAGYALSIRWRARGVERRGHAAHRGPGAGERR